MSKRTAGCVFASALFPVVAQRSFIITGRTILLLLLLLVLLGLLVLLLVLLVMRVHAMMTIALTFHWRHQRSVRRQDLKIIIKMINF